MTEADKKEKQAPPEIGTLSTDTPEELAQDEQSIQEKYEDAMMQFWNAIMVFEVVRYVCEGTGDKKTAEDAANKVEYLRTIGNSINNKEPIGDYMLAAVKNSITNKDAGVSSQHIKKLILDTIDLKEGELPKGSTMASVMEVLNATENLWSSDSKLPKINLSASSIDALDFPLDKINTNIWYSFDRTGQMAFDVGKRGSGEDAAVMFCINFDEVQNDVALSKTLNAYDKRIYEVVGALIAENGNFITVSQIYKTMGGRNNPSTEDIRKINESLSKMNSTKIYYDNTPETKAYKKQVKQIYDGSLLPMERITASVNGQITNAALHFFREPPLISFARDRKQITKIPVKLLAAPLSKTDQNLRIEDYLILRISQMKHTSNAKTPKKILFKTLFEKTGIAPGKQQSRALGKIRKYLDHFIANDFIKGYTEDDKGINIKL